MKLTCEWRGAVISRHTKKRCRWVDDHKVGKKKYCCKKIRSCGSKKCKILSKKCGFTGETIQFKTEAKCSWAKFTGYKQRKCCYKRIRCKNHKNCRTIRSKCKYLGSKVTQHQFHTCKRLKEANGFRKRCCSYIRHCYGNRCHNSRKVCKTGKLFTYSTIKECHNEKVVKGWRRKVCCSGAKVCAGSKCKTLRRICKVTKKRVETDKHKKITLLRIKKWKEEKVVLQKKITDECNCYLQEKENLQFFREKRTKFSKKYQKCRKVKIEKRCVKFFDKLNYFAEKSTKQRALRNKKKIQNVQVQNLNIKHG